MKAKLVRHDKVCQHLINHTAINNSLVYIVNDKRVIGYDNVERKGDHRHYGDRIELYRFESLEKLTKDFYLDVQKYREGKL